MPCTEIHKCADNFSHKSHGIMAGTERSLQGQPSSASPPAFGALVRTTAVTRGAAAGAVLFAGPGLVRQRDEWSEVWKGGKREAGGGGAGWPGD